MQIDEVSLGKGDLLAIFMAQQGLETASLLAGQAFEQAVAGCDGSNILDPASALATHYAILAMHVAGVAQAVVQRAREISPFELSAFPGGAVSICGAMFNPSEISKEQLGSVLRCVGEFVRLRGDATVKLVERLTAGEEPASQLLDKWRAALKELSDASNAEVARLCGGRSYASTLN